MAAGTDPQTPGGPCRLSAWTVGLLLGHISQELVQSRKGTPPTGKTCLMPSPVRDLPHSDRTYLGSLCMGPHPTLSLRMKLSVFLVIKGKLWCWTRQHLPPNCSSAAPSCFPILCSFQLPLLPKSHPANHSSIPILGKPGKGALLSWLLKRSRCF